MQRISLTLFLGLFLSFGTYSQTVKPSPSADDGEVVKISTNLIQLDATITDKKGNPIPDLRPDEVEIYENGEKRKITNFSYISNLRPEGAVTSSGETVNLPPTRVRPEQVRRTIALVVDDLALSFESAFHTKQALRKFINEQMQDGDLVAIIRTGAGIGALQQFTTDKRQLLAAAGKVRWNVNGAGNVGAFAPISPTLAEQIDGPNDLSARKQAERELEQEVTEFRETVFVSGTLGALNYIIKGMDELPGRKSVVMFSDGFSLVQRDGRGNFRDSIILDGLRRLTDLANRSSVVVYTIDARGLIAGTGLMAEDNTFGMTADDVERRLSDRRSRVFESQEGLRYLADQTGGFAQLNKNDLNKGLDRVLRDQSYYLIGYQPDDETFDPKLRRYNKIEIKVNREGARARYRSGFFGFSEEQIRKPATTALQAITRALTSPFGVNDISLRLNAVFASGENARPLVRSYLHIDGTELTFIRQPNGEYETSFDILAFSFGGNGLPVDQISNTHSLTVTEEGYQKIRRKGFVYNFTFPIKKAGGYQMRVAVRDAKTNKIGSASQFIDVPSLKKDRLTLSGMVLENMPVETWQKISADPSSYAELRKTTDPVTDTALRQFSAGTVVRFGFEIYNAKRNKAGTPSLSTQIRLFKDNKLLFEGQTIALQTVGQLSPEKIESTGNFRLGGGMEPGEYILQLVVIDKLAKAKRNEAVQFIQFEVVE